jgi:DNA polymerase-3 subunit delta'
MPLLPLFGHAALQQRLDAMVERGTLPASLLLQGPPGIGKQQLALWLGRRLICAEPGSPCGACRDCQYLATGNHPDLRWYFPRARMKDANDVALEDVARERDEAVADRVQAGGLYARPDGSSGIFAYHTRLLVADAVRTPALAKRKVFVIGDAERMSAQAGADVAANALLKLLEEPLPDTTIILTSSEPGALLPTIRSRVVIVRVAALRDDDVRTFLGHPDVAKALGPGRTEERVRSAGGAPGRLIGATDADAISERARQLLDAASANRDVLLRTAFVQGSSKSRGGFTDVLDAVTVLLHERTQTAVLDGDAARAATHAKAIRVVEEAKRAAEGNANPQLVSAHLLSQLREIIA